MKICTITFSTSESYGALLQAYALKLYLKKRYACQVDALNYAPYRLTARYSFIPFYGKQGGLFEACKGAVHNIYYLDKFCFRKYRMKKFMKQKLNLPKYKIKKVSDMDCLNYAIYVIGSDQVWNPSITLGLDDIFWGNFKRAETAKCISYAASLGRARPEIPKNIVEQMLKQFDAVSVREKSSYDFIQKYYSGNIAIHIDPVFLLESKEWETLAKEPSVKKYVLLFYTEKNRELIEKAKKIADYYDVPLVSLNYTKDKNMKCICDCGPQEMLGYMKNAHCIVTNSFHGCAFAAIFHKTFYYQLHSEFGNRVEDLMSLFDIQSKCLKSGEVFMHVDWRFVEEQIAKEVKKAEQYFDSIILRSNND